MRNKKGILVLLALSLLCGCFTGCKKDKEDSKETKETTQTTVVSSTVSGTAAEPTETTSISTYAPLYRTPQNQNQMNPLFVWNTAETPCSRRRLTGSLDIMLRWWKSRWTAPRSMTMHLKTTQPCRHFLFRIPIQRSEAMLSATVAV